MAVSKGRILCLTLKQGSPGQSRFALVAVKNLFCIEGYNYLSAGSVNISCPERGVYLHTVKANFLCKEVLRAKVLFIVSVLHHIALSNITYEVFSVKFEQRSNTKYGGHRWEDSLVELLSSSQGSGGVSAPVKAFNHEQSW